MPSSVATGRRRFPEVEPMEPSGMCLSGLRWREREQRGKESGEFHPIGAAECRHARFANFLCHAVRLPIDHFERVPGRSFDTVALADYQKGDLPDRHGGFRSVEVLS